MIPTYYPAQSAFYLEHEYGLRLKRRPYYSYRAFARDLDLSPSTLNEFLKGKTGFSRGRAEKVASKLGLPNEHRDHFCDLVELEYHKKSSVRAFAKARVVTRSATSKAKIALEHFTMVRDWYHLAALEFLELDGKQRRRRWPRAWASPRKKRRARSPVC